MRPDGDLPEALKKGLSPRPGFLEEGKHNFLAAFDASALSRPQILAATKNSRITYLFKFGIGALAFVAVIVSASAYADTANVSATSPLYPLKRLGENVQLALTPASQKARVQATFAVRRVDEITQLQATQPSSTLIRSLDNDLNADISSSVNMDNSEKGNKGAGDNNDKKVFTALCMKLSGTLGANLLSHADLLARFNAKCASDSNSTSTMDTASKVIIPALSSTDLNAISPSSGNGDNGKHGNNGNWNNQDNRNASDTIIENSSTLNVQGILPLEKDF